jgi:hypothetical protein
MLGGGPRGEAGKRTKREPGRGHEQTRDEATEGHRYRRHRRVLDAGWAYSHTGPDQGEPCGKTNMLSDRNKDK